MNVRPIGLMLILIMTLLPASLASAQEDTCVTPDGWEATYIVQAGDNLFRIAQGYDIELDELVAANCIEDIQNILVGLELAVPNDTDTHPTFVPIAMALSGDNGANGQLLGCGDSAIHVSTNRIATGDTERDLEVSLDELMNPNPNNTFPANAVNDWASYAVTVRDVSVDEGFALINLEGDFLRPGHCGDARLAGLLTHTIFSYPDIDEAIIAINGDNMRVLFDESGLLDHEASYTRGTSSDYCTIPAGWFAYEVQAGDNLFRISQRAESTLDFISSRNCIDDPSNIVVGTTIYTPIDITESEE